MYDKTTEYVDRPSETKAPLAGLPDQSPGDWTAGDRINQYTYGGVPVQLEVGLNETDQGSIFEVGNLLDQMEVDDEVDVAHQGHYSGDVQPIQLIESLGWMEVFAAGNVIKYVARYQRKNGLEDLKKAQTYLGWLIKAVEERG